MSFSKPVPSNNENVTTWGERLCVTLLLNIYRWIHIYDEPMYFPKAPLSLEGFAQMARDVTNGPWAGARQPGSTGPPTCASASWTAGKPWLASSTPATSSWLVLCWECVPARVFWSLDRTVLKSEADGIVGRLGATPNERMFENEIKIIVNLGSLSVVAVLSDHLHWEKKKTC